MSAAASACPACGAGQRAGANFCDSCGAPLASAQPPRAARDYTPRHLVERILRDRTTLQGERRRITVLFADVKGSTEIAARVGPERWHLILDGLFELLAAAVHRFEGSVNQYTGDGIMALFGAPIAHEDDADRACLAAWDMQRAMRAHAAETSRRHGVDLGLRVGLNSGEAVVGRIGDDLRMDYTAQGLTVNLAQRMEALCEPGAIVLTQATATALRGSFALESLGAQRVRGADAPVTAFRLRDAPPPPELERGLARTAFVGRDPEMAQLRASLQAVATGGGRLATVSGAAGVGKTRLCREFVERVRADGTACHRAWCSPYARAHPLAPVRRLLVQRLGLDALDAAAVPRAAAALAPHDAAPGPITPLWLDFLGLRGADAPPLAPTPGQRKRLLAAVAATLLDGGPQVLLVEDLHWADPDTEDFLRALAAQLPRSRSLLLLNFRPDYAADWVQAATPALRLGELAGAELQAFADQLLGDTEQFLRLRRELLERTRGNPFYLEQAVRHLRESGLLRGESAAPHAAQPWSIPDSVHALLAARMDRLPPGARQILQALSVIGLRADRALLRWLASVPEAAFERGLAALRAADYVAADRSGAELRFGHPLMQEVAYGMQLETHRVAMHARLATELVRLHPATGAPHQDWLAAADHWTRAREWAQAGDWHLRVARWLSSADPSGAASAFRQAMSALDAAPETPDVLANRIAARAGMLLQLQIWPLARDEVERLFKEAQQLALKTRNLHALGEVFIAYTVALLQRGEAESARRLMADVVQQAIATGNGSSVSRFRLTVLLVFICAGQPREGVALVNQATGCAWLEQAVGEDNYLSRGAYGFIQCWLGELAAGRDNMNDTAAFGAAHDSLGWSDAFLSDYAWLSGDTDGVVERARRALQRAEAYGSPFITLIAQRGLALALIVSGDFAPAVTILEANLALTAPGAVSHHFEALFLSTLALAYAGAGRFGDAAAVAERAIDSAQGSRSRLWEAVAWVSYLELPREAVNAARAAEGLVRALELIDAIGAEGLRPWWWCARQRWATDPAAAARYGAAAVQAFTRIGATAHAHRIGKRPQAQTPPLRPGSP